MQDNNIKQIIYKSLLVDKNELNKNIKDIINQLQLAFNNNSDMILKANKIDEKNSNGFIMDFKIIDNIFSNVKKENIMYGEVTLSIKDEFKKIIYGKEILDCGNVIVVNDGNPYVIIEMILRNIIAGNTTIFTNDGFMYGTNKLLIEITQSILESYNISKYLTQIYITEDFNEVLSNYANIDLVICIGNNNLQNLILNNSKNKVITSGYENFDLYIEDKSHLYFLNKIVNTKLNIGIYINRDIKIDHDDAILVDDIDEAIAQINYNGNKYSSAIFTNSKENASKFIKEVKSKIVTVNTSPTIERIIDIKQSDLINEKTIIYPLSFNLDETKEIITSDENNV